MNLFIIEEIHSIFVQGIVDADIHFLSIDQEKVSEGLNIFMAFLTY